MKKILFIAFLVVLGATFYAEALEIYHWNEVDQGFVRAKAENKMVAIDFYSPNEGWQKKMDDPARNEVRQLLQDHFIFMKINVYGENIVSFKGRKVLERDLAQEFMVSVYPTLVFMDADAHPLTYLQGYVAPPDMLAVLKYLLKIK